MMEAMPPLVEKPVFRPPPSVLPVAQLPRLDDQPARITEAAPPVPLPSMPVVEQKPAPPSVVPVKPQGEAALFHPRKPEVHSAPPPVFDSAPPKLEASPVPPPDEVQSFVRGNEFILPPVVVEQTEFRPRRPQPPRAQPPAEEVPIRKPRAMSNPPPAEVVFKPERQPPPPAPPAPMTQAAPVEEPALPAFERELPPQVGEWPPRRPRTEEANPWRGLMFLSLAVFAFTIAAWIYWQDDRMPSEETLQLKRETDDAARPAVINRMRTLLTSVAPVQTASQVSVPAWQWSTPELVRMVDANGVAKENLRDLLAEQDWHPHHKAWFEEDIGVHGAWSSLAILKQAEAAYLMRRGEEDAAFAAAIDLAKLARSMQELHAWPSYYDRSLQLFERACQSLAELLKSSRMAAGRLTVLQEEFARCAPSDQLLRSAMSGWYLFEKKLMMGPESREPIDTLPGGIVYERPGRLFFKPNRTLDFFVRSFQDLRDEAEKAPYARSSQASKRARRIGPTVGLPNSGGEGYFANRIAPYLELPDRQSIAHAQHAVVTTLFAIRRFSVEYHRLPPKLLNLRPDYLKDLPIDPFSGETLKYDFVTRVVSSVGTNFNPDGGKPAADPPLSDPREIAAQAGSVQ